MAGAKAPAFFISMTSKVDEPFNPEIKSTPPSKELRFEIAGEEHIEAITNLMHLRNPNAEISFLEKRVSDEVTKLNDGESYGVFVATIKNKVVGFCRFYHSDKVPPEKIKHDHPIGIYLMGIVVDPDYRRKGVASFLHEQRLMWLSSIDVDRVYSVVAIDNLTSQAMHEKFGFHKVSEVLGVLTVSFDLGRGILYERFIFLSSHI